jgi:single-stranded DNA-binding protein
MMQLHVSGRLVRDPQAKVSAAGKPYVSGLVAVDAGEKEMLATVMCFDGDLQTLLGGLKKGDGVSAAGTGSIAAYLDKAGAPQASLTVMANRLMAMTDRQAAPRPRSERRESRQTDERQPYQPAGPREFAPDDFNDSIPF